MQADFSPSIDGSVMEMTMLPAEGLDSVSENFVAELGPNEPQKGLWFISMVHIP